MEKKIVILGATSGIGKELARLYAKTGDKVIITGRRTHLLENMQREETSFGYKTMDITQVGMVVQTLNDIAAEWGQIDMVILSSGTGDINSQLDFDIEKRTIDTNVTGFTCVCDWIMNYFEKQGNGHLVAITSVAGIRGDKRAPAYNASKSYQMNYLEGMRQKALSAGSPIYVTDVRPGFVDTAMAKGEGLFWVAPVEKAACQIVKGIRKKKRVVYITKRWRIVAWVLKNISGRIYERLGK